MLGLLKASDSRGFNPNYLIELQGTDLVISLDRARDQARRFRVSEGAELARLVIHGALHLAGLDHRRPVERRRMRARENAVLKSQRTSVQALERALRRDAASAAKHAGAARRRG